MQAEAVGVLNSETSQPEDKSFRGPSQETSTPIGEIPTTIHRIELVRLADIQDGGAQMRVEMWPETVVEYANEMLNGTSFPPVILFHDGSTYWQADGFHRVEAARKIKRETILAEIRNGTARDAVLHGTGANATHGLRRTQADKRRAVECLLRDPEWSAWSSRKIAEVARVDHKTVTKIRAELTGEIPTRTTERRTGEFPKPAGKPDGARPELIDALLRTLSNEKLIAECRRRGLTVEGEHV
jgi:uncharacterized ParB-like nuclease family protein